ncbi:MAG: hypothetical protein RBS17_01925 [Coriobacteriia bacterium]|nr:hypothetical protein [Coriobacteriia bacterium]
MDPFPRPPADQLSGNRPALIGHPAIRRPLLIERFLVRDPSRFVLTIGIVMVPVGDTAPVVPLVDPAKLKMAFGLRRG